MNAELFLRFQHAAPDGLLEEAMEKPARTGRRSHIRVLAFTAAACLCVGVGLALWRGGSGAKSAQYDMTAAAGDAGEAMAAAEESNEMADMAAPAPRAPEESAPEADEAEEPMTMMSLANPVHASSAEELESLGYGVALPADAADAEYLYIDMGGDYAAPLAQATFTSGGTEYTYRALKTGAREDISGIYDDWEESLCWTVGTVQLELRRSGENCWVGWYVPEEGLQCCLSGGGDARLLLDTAWGMARDLGHELAAAPEGAREVSCGVFELDGKTVAETRYTLDGVRWVYRTAATSALELEDISGLPEDGWARSVRGEELVSWCPARLDWNEDGEGRILWFDVVPGLVYSLSCDSAASQQALLDMAGSMFVPAQGDAP